MKYLQQFVTTFLNVGGGINASQTTGIVFQSLNNLDATKPSVACLSWADPLDTSVAEWITYTSINSTTNELNGVVRGAEGYSAKTHSNQAVVAFPLSKAHVNELNDAVVAEHSSAGVHSVAGMISGGSVKDQDDMADDSATALATQQSIKAYVDTYGQFSSMARQAIINGNFDVWQRGTSLTVGATTTDFIADRWRIQQGADSGTLPTLVHTRQALTAGDIPNSFYHYRVAPNGAGTSLGVNSYGVNSQTIEHGTRLLCGLNKTVTVSFYARASVAGKKMGISLNQNYGSGGSPSAAEYIAGTTISLTSSWAKYTATFTTNTLVGKTFGTDNNDSLELVLWHMWGSTLGTARGLTGTETYGGSGTIDFTQVQLCAGSVALPFQPKSYEDELRACQRYYYRKTANGTYASARLSAGQCYSSSQAIIFTEFPVTMRIIPTPGASGTLGLNQPNTAISTATLNTIVDGTIYNCNVAYQGASGLTAGHATMLSANADANAYIDFSAEL